MAQSLNTKVDYNGKAIAYLGFPQYGQIMIGDRAFEFFDDRDVEKNMQFPWQSIKVVEGEVSKSFKGTPQIGRQFYVVFANGQKVRFSSKDSGKILKIIREYIGNDKVVKSRSFTSNIASIFKKRKKKED